MADTFAKYHCNYCDENIKGLRVRCLECEDFDLCLQCFACGAQIGKHKAGHGYQFMDTGNFSIFPGHGHWSAREEVRLLDAIEQYGYGNWDDISQHIETRTSDEAKHKFIASYIEGSVGRLSWKPVQERSKNMPMENAMVDVGPLSPTLASSISYPPATHEETAYLGYMLNRDDFDKEWDNDAEVTIAPLFIHPVDDDEVDMALKLAQVDMYMRRLRERGRRKRVVRDFNLAPKFYAKEKERLMSNPATKRKPKDDKEIMYDKLKPVSQFHTAAEHQSVISSLCRERELKIRIKELLRYRRNGISHVEECAEFEVARMRRDRKKDLKKKGLSLDADSNPLDFHLPFQHIHQTQNFPFTAEDRRVSAALIDPLGREQPARKIKRRRKRAERFNRPKMRCSRYWRWKMAQQELERQQQLLQLQCGGPSPTAGGPHQQPPRRD